MSRLRHAKVSTKADGGDSTLVLPSDWNNDHTGTWVDAITSSSSNTLVGQVDFRAEGSLGISLASNTVTIGLNMPVASTTSIAAASNSRIDVNGGSRLRFPVTDLPGSIEGDVWYSPYWDELWMHDGVRAVPASEVGFLPYAFAGNIGGDSTTATANNLAANGGTMAAPVMLWAPMLLQSISWRQTDTTLARIAEVSLFMEDSRTGARLIRIGGTYGRETFTAAAASTRTVNVDTPGIMIPPGCYWVVIRNLHTANTYGVGVGAAGTLALNNAQTKTIAGSMLTAATLDFTAATWTKITTNPGIRLNGRVFGQAAAF